MREIKFRGKNIKGEWHYGLLCHDKTKDTDYEWFISNSAGKPYAFGAVENTIGQFTGLTDKNGNEIYEGDILQVNTEIVVCEDDDFFSENVLMHQEITGYVSYTENFAAFELITIEEDRFLKAWGFYGEEDAYTLDVIGNIHDNPELLKP